MYPLTLLCIAAARRGISSVGLRLTAPSAEGAKGAASADAGFRLCGHDQRTEPVWRLCNRPLETFAPCGGQSLAGRGGSVSRRDHNQAYRRRVTFQAEPTEKKCRNPNASRSSGKGVWGRGASLREAASPPASPHTSLRERARGRVLLFREAPFLAITYSIIAHSTVRLFSFWRWRDRRQRPSAERCQCRGRSRSASRGNQRIADAFPARQ